MRNTIRKNHPARTTSRVLRGPIKSIGLVQKFFKYNIKNCPSIATSYVRFVAQHSSIGKVDAITIILD